MCDFVWDTIESVTQQFCFVILRNKVIQVYNWKLEGTQNSTNIKLPITQKLQLLTWLVFPLNEGACWNCTPWEWCDLSHLIKYFIPSKSAPLPNPKLAIDYSFALNTPHEIQKINNAKIHHWTSINSSRFLLLHFNALLTIRDFFAPPPTPHHWFQVVNNRNSGTELIPNEFQSSWRANSANHQTDNDTRVLDKKNARTFRNSQPASELCAALENKPEKVLSNRNSVRHAQLMW